jgi:hypothetical protein
MIEEGSKESLAGQRRVYLEEKIYQLPWKLQTKIPKMNFFQKFIFYILDE